MRKIFPLFSTIYNHESQNLSARPAIVGIGQDPRATPRTATIGFVWQLFQVQADPRPDSRPQIGFDWSISRAPPETAFAAPAPGLSHQFRFVHAGPAALLPLQGEPLHLYLLLERHGEFLLDAFAEDRAGII